MAAHSFRVLFTQFFKIFILVSKILYISTSISKIFAAGLEPATIRNDQIILPQLQAIHTSLIYDQISHQSHIRKIIKPDGIWIFIWIIQYPVNGYLDSKLSVLSIPSNNTIQYHKTPDKTRQNVAVVVKGRKSVYRKRRKTRKTCFIYKASQKANNNIY